MQLLISKQHSTDGAALMLAALNILIGWAACLQLSCNLGSMPEALLQVWQMRPLVSM